MLPNQSQLVIFVAFQAVSFMLADMAIGVESSRLCYMKSGWQADHGMRNTYMASIAKCLAGDVANKVNKYQSITCHRTLGEIEMGKNIQSISRLLRERSRPELRNEPPLDSLQFLLSLNLFRASPSPDLIQRLD